MDLPFIIYLIEVICDNKGIGILAFIGCFAWIVGFVVYCISNTATSDDQNYDSYQAYIKTYKNLWGTKVAIICLVTIANLLPSKESAYIMLAAYGVEKVIDNPQVQELAGNSLKVLDKAMKDYLEESEVK